jgi:hypothetical protein
MGCPVTRTLSAPGRPPASRLYAIRYKGRPYGQIEATSPAEAVAQWVAKYPEAVRPNPALVTARAAGRGA